MTKQIVWKKSILQSWNTFQPLKVRYGNTEALKWQNSSKWIMVSLPIPEHSKIASLNTEDNTDCLVLKERDKDMER